MGRVRGSRGAMRLGMLALTFCGSVHAQSSSRPVEPYRLSWTRERGAESCISGAALARLLDQVVGSAAASGATTLLEGRVSPAPAPLRWRVGIRVITLQGEL